MTAGSGGGGGGGSVVTPSTLPRTGVFENLTNLAIAGMVLILIGGGLKLIP